MGDGDDDEFGSSSGNRRNCKNPLTKGATIALIIGYTILVILATAGVVIVVGIETDTFCDCSSNEKAAEVVKEYREVVGAFSQGYSNDVCYDGMDEDAPHVYGIFTLDGVGAIPRRAQVDGRVCYPEIIPWQALSSSEASSSPAEDSHSVYDPVWS